MIVPPAVGANRRHDPNGPPRESAILGSYEVRLTSAPEREPCPCQFDPERLLVRPRPAVPFARHAGPSVHPTKLGAGDQQTRECRAARTAAASGNAKHATASTRSTLPKPAHRMDSPQDRRPPRCLRAVVWPIAGVGFRGSTLLSAGPLPGKRLRLRAAATQPAPAVPPGVRRCRRETCGHRSRCR